MEKKNLQTSVILKWVCFALYTYLGVSGIGSRFGFFGDIFSGDITFQARIVAISQVLYLIGNVLVPVGILFKKKELSFVAFLMLIVSGVLLVFNNLQFGILRILGDIARVAAYFLAAMICKDESKRTVPMGLACAGLLFVSRLFWVLYMGSILGKYHFAGLVSLSNLMLYAASFLLIFAFKSVPGTAAAKVSRPASVVPEDKIEHLTKLKDLLDKGILTQEEFEEKKKQILDN